MNNQPLHKLYINALLEGESILSVKQLLDESLENWQRQLSRQYETARLLETTLAAPDDDPARIAVIQFLTSLKGGAEE